MSMFGNYHILKAETAETIAQHLALTEHLVWPPLLLAELESEMHSITGHCVAEDVACLEKKKKKKSGSTGEGEETGGGSKSGSGNAAKKTGRLEEEPEILEAHALLLYKTAIGAHSSTGTMTAPLAAATMLFNRAEKSAQLRTTLTTDNPAKQQSATEYLPSFERHAAQVGANVMYVRVHPSAMGIFKRELGYEAVGSVTIENGLQIQAMRKIIGFHPALPGDVPT